MARPRRTVPGITVLQMIFFCGMDRVLAQSCAADYSRSVAATSTTTTFGPVAAPDIDTSNPVNFIPAVNVSLYYGSSQSQAPNGAVADSHGSINMNLELTSNTVVLEYIDSVKAVECTHDSVVVAFQDDAAFQLAVDSWLLEESLIMVTNHLGSCDTEFDRGFFTVDSLTTDAPNLSITCNASKQQISKIAETCELHFSSVPAGKLARRLTLDPSFSVPFSKSLARDTVLASVPPHLTVTANQADFSSEITFSGYLYYDFWAFKLRQLYFDIDTDISAAVALTADFAASYSNSFTYAPTDLTYTLINVPGIVQLGPGIAFGLEMDLAASAAVDVAAGLSISIPDGNVHVDLLDSVNTVATGWKPSYTPHANISAQADIRADVNTSVTVQMALNFLGGLVDLSGGLIAKPGVANAFTLDANLTTETSQKNMTTGGRKPDLDQEEKSCGDGVGWKSDFVFSLDAFATRSWSMTLVKFGASLLDICYQF
ncbi:hypothetical protein BBP40_004191 [Aspergillus hancockii]|nr:hypothetical protein BBP40_004191 [Aspergillus hancockii]